MFKTVSRFVLGGLFIAAGANHFLNKPLYVRIMPPSIPWPQFMVELSGVCESVLGAALLWEPVRRRAAWGVIALLVAVFPANWHMARHAEQFPEFRPALLWGRLPFQAVFIAWAYWHTRPDGNGGLGKVPRERSLAQSPQSRKGRGRNGRADTPSQF